MTEPKIIQLVADYGVGDPAYAEVVQKLTFLDRNTRVNKINVPKFSTVATGIWIAQLSTVNAFPGLVIYSNTAPRIKEALDEKGVYGHFAYSQLDNGVIVLGVHVGFTFSFIKDHIQSLNLVNVPNAGSQFRSRDYYPDAVVGLAHGDKKYIGREIPLNTIPDPPNNVIGFIDGYGNMKTTMRHSQNALKAGTKVNITVGEVTKAGVVSDDTFEVHEDGALSFAPGSTGGSDRFMEIWVKGDSAWEAFAKPSVEQDFIIEPV